MRLRSNLNRDARGAWTQVMPIRRFPATSTSSGNAHAAAPTSPGPSTSPPDERLGFEAS
jgi:hypothetical protein